MKLFKQLNINLILDCCPQRNDELQRENCELVKERDELLHKCKIYEEELEQHKQHGCLVPMFNPPFDLNQILDSTIPPSPDFSELGSLGTPSPCPSPSRSLSPAPGPEPQHQQVQQGHVLARQPHDSLVSGFSSQYKDHMMKDVTMPGMADNKREADFSTEPLATSSAELQQARPAETKHRFLTVKDNDGKPRTLRLSQEDYEKVMQRLKALECAQQQQPHGQDQKQQSTVPSVSAQQVVSVPKAQQEDAFNFNVNTSQSQDVPVYMETPYRLQGSEEKLDTMDLVISVMKGMIKDEDKEYVLNTIPPDHVMKEEPQDPEYFHTGDIDDQGMLASVEMTEQTVKQERSGGSNISETNSEVYTEESALTGWQIRAGVETVTSLEHADTSHAGVEYLLEDEDNGMFTISALDPQNVQIVEEMRASTDPKISQLAGQPAIHMARLNSSRSAGHNIIYIGSSDGNSSVNTSIAAASSKAVAAKLQKAETAAFPIKPFITLQNVAGDGNSAISMPTMQNIKLRPKAQHLMAQSPSQTTGVVKNSQGPGRKVLFSLFEDANEPRLQKKTPSSTVTSQTSAMQRGVQPQGTARHKEISSWHQLATSTPPPTASQPLVTAITRQAWDSADMAWTINSQQLHWQLWECSKLHDFKNFCFCTAI